jgi:hypothetical protein
VYLDEMVNGKISINTILHSITSYRSLTSQRHRRRQPQLLQVAQTSEEILDELFLTRTCEECELPSYKMNMKKWRGRCICLKCHTKAIENSPIVECVRDLYDDGCENCHMKDDTYQLYPKNIFSKVKSVMKMVDLGDPEEEIRAELTKCCLLCNECHSFVTRIEKLLGFTRKKELVARKFNAGEDISGLIPDLYDAYANAMMGMYPLIREKVLGRRGVRVGRLMDA